MKAPISLAAVLALLGALFAAPQLAAEEADSEQVAALRAKLERDMPQLPITSISESPLPGVLELISGARVLYLTPDAKYMIDGSIIDLDSRENLTAQTRGRVQYAAIEAVGEENMLIFRPEDGGSGRSITVFTDTNCGFCQKLHREIDSLLEAGISVRYLMVPLRGSRAVMESVWCADDPQQAMTDAKAGRDVPERSCDNPIDQHVALSREVGLRGTPLIFVDDGSSIPGYRPAQDLIKAVTGGEPLALK